MFIVYTQDNEMHKNLMFVTDNQKTASSFCHTFNVKIQDLHNIYIKEYCLRRMKESWFYESGFNGKIQELTDQLNISIEIKFNEVKNMIMYCETFKYEDIKKL